MVAAAQQKPNVQEIHDAFDARMEFGQALFGALNRGRLSGDLSLLGESMDIAARTGAELANFRQREVVAEENRQASRSASDRLPSPMEFSFDLQKAVGDAAFNVVNTAALSGTKDDLAAVAKTLRTATGHLLGFKEAYES